MMELWLRGNTLLRAIEPMGGRAKMLKQGFTLQISNSFLLGHEKESSITSKEKSKLRTGIQKNTQCDSLSKKWHQTAEDPREIHYILTKSAMPQERDPGLELNLIHSSNSLFFKQMVI